MSGLGSNMRIALLLLLCMMASVMGCRTGPQPVSSIADELRQNVSSYWSFTASNSAIYVKSKDEVYLLNPLNPPDYSNTTFKTYGLKTNYEFVLSFVPRLSDAELKKIHEERLPYERIRTTMENYGQVQGELDKRPLPSFYTKNYSIFIEPNRYIDFYLVYPPEAVQQISNLTNCLMKTFQMY
jgi:hypothetical protein